MSGQTGRTIGTSQVTPSYPTQKADQMHLPGHRGQRPPIPERRLMAPLPQTPCIEATPAASSQDQASNVGGSSSHMSPSQRALSCASGCAVPVSPHRAESRRSLRSAAVPSYLQPPSVRGRSPAPSSSMPDMGTMRTDDLLQSFPPPPNQPDPPQLRSSRSTPGKRPSWSLFPRANNENEAAIPLQRLHPLQVTPSNPAIHRVDGTNGDPLTPSTVRNFLRETHGRFFTARTSLSNVHDESVSGCDIHARQRSDDNVAHQPTLGSRPPQVVAPGEGGQAQHQPRVVSQCCSRDRDIHTPNAAQLEDMSALTATPTRVVQGPQLCKHKLAKLKGRYEAKPTLHIASSARFDGSNAVAGSDPIVQDHADTGPRNRASLAGTNLTVLPPAPVGNNTIAIPERQINQGAPTPSSPSTPRTVATAPAGTTFVTNPGGSTFAIDPGDPHYRPTARAATFNTLQSGPSEHDRA